MSQKRRNNLAAWGIFVLLNLWFASCSEGEFSIGDDFIETSTYTAIVDTFSLELSTIKNDSVATSSTGIALVGYIDQAEFGTLKSSSYFKLANTIDGVDSKEQFDSLCLVLKHSGYCYGDTLVPFEFGVHLLSEDLADQSSLYNINQVAYDLASAGTKRYFPEPSSTDEIMVRMNDELGLSLLDSLQNASNLDFDDWIKGMVLVPDTINNEAVIGYEAAVDSINLRLYTHTTGLEETEMVHDFGLTTATLQYNHIVSDTKDSPLSKLINYKQNLSEVEFNNMAVLQGGIGYFARIDFEGLSAMRSLKEKGRIVKASLNVEVMSNSNEYNALPSSLFLVEADNINQFSGYVVDSEGNSLTATLEEAPVLYEQGAIYSFDITYFLNAMIEEEVIPEGSGVIIALPEDDLYGSVDRVVFKGFKNTDSETKLNVFYYYYDKE